jgi:hypothetical protein
MFFIFLVTFLGSVFAMICIFKPIQIAKIMTRWTVESLRNSGVDIGSDLQKRITLLENDLNEYEKLFKSEILQIRQTGYTALFVSIIGLFIGLFAK